MQDKDTTKSTFFQFLKPFLHSEFFNQHLIDQEIDKYVKKLSTTQLIELIAYAQLEQQESLRSISNSLNHEKFKQFINLDSFSSSQISRR